MVETVSLRRPYARSFYSIFSLCIESNSLVRKQLLLFFKGGVYWWCKNTAIKRLPWLSLKPYIKTASPFARINKARVLLRLDLWPQCSKISYRTQTKIPQMQSQSICGDIVRNLNRIYIYIYIYYNRLIGLVGRVFANDPGDLGSIPGRVIPKTLKMVLDTSLLNTRQYKVRIKGKVEQFWERSSALSLHIGVAAIEKGAFWSPSTKVASFTYIYIEIESRVGSSVGARYPEEPV